MWNVSGPDCNPVSVACLCLVDPVTQKRGGQEDVSKPLSEVQPCGALSVASGYRNGCEPVDLVTSGIILIALIAYAINHSDFTMSLTIVSMVFLIPLLV